MTIKKEPINPIWKAEKKKRIEKWRKINSQEQLGKKEKKDYILSESKDTLGSPQPMDGSSHTPDTNSLAQKEMKLGTRPDSPLVEMQSYQKGINQGKLLAQKECLDILKDLEYPMISFEALIKEYEKKGATRR